MDRGVYQILNLINEDRYIGSAIDLFKRYNEHKNDLKGGRHHNIRLQRAYNKYGEENFEFSIIEYVDGKEDLIGREQFHMDSYDWAELYNIYPTARSNSGRKLSEEHKKKISLSMVGRFKGKNNPMYGKSHSEETKKKFSECRRGKLHPFYGKKHSDETRKKMLTSQKGKEITFKGRSQNISAWARELGLNCKSISQRLIRGWSVERILTTPDTQDE